MAATMGRRATWGLEWRGLAVRSHTQLFEEGERRGEVWGDVPAGHLAGLFIAVVVVTISNWLLAPDNDERFDEACSTRISMIGS